MTTDISRKTFDPRRNTVWTTAMQGRVTTDAPQNEDRRIRDRRFRSQTVDLIGRCGYPAALPTSFEIGVSGGALTVGAGRYYVDGHQVQNFGAGPRSFDPVLSETVRLNAIPIADQPYLPGAPPLAPADGLHLVYLDVWQRDVTFLEDDTIIDPAIPVDTFARRQTVWQARVFGPAPAGTTCATEDADIPGWPAVIAPSAARLSTRPNPASAVADPCLLPPGAEYRGIDNRTYSYVVHDIAPDGTPLVKFSRTHGVVATAILSLPLADTLEVTEVAKDDFLRFNAGDWVEITDEARLLSGTPGTMARVLVVDDPSNTITLEDPLPAGAVRLDGAGPDLDQQFHPVIRRWDQSGQIRDEAGDLVVDLDLPGAGGLIPAPTGGLFVALEDGVEAALTLSPAGGAPRIGDAWTFAARYADGSVEELSVAPPEDFQHHYCRLALVDAVGGAFIAPAAFDCRDPIDLGGECCCSVIVHPGDDIQAAIDSLPPDFGGCVCLKAGVHLIRTALVIATPNVTLHGECHGVTVRRETPGPVLRVVGTGGAEVHAIRFEHPSGQIAEGIVDILGSEGVTVAGCVFAAADGAASTGVLIADGRDVTVADCGFEGLRLGVVMPARCDHVRIEDNRMTLGGAQFPGLMGVTARQALGPITVTGNRIDGALTGISVNDDPTGPARGSLADGTLIARNRIVLARSSAEPGEDASLFGIDTAADDVGVHDNHVAFAGSARAGIRASGVGVKLTGNTVIADFVADDDARNIGILIGAAPGQDALTEAAEVTGNSLRGMTAGVVARDLRDILIAGNDIDPFPTAMFQPGIMLHQAISARVADNAIRGAGSGIIASQGRHLRVSGNLIADTGFGIGIALELSPTVSGNTIANAALFGALSALCIARTSFTGNHVSNTGWIGGLSVGLGALLMLGEWHVEGNEVANTGVAPGGDANGAPARGIAGIYVLEARIESNLVTYTAPDLLPDGREDRALLLQGLLELSFSVGAAAITFGFPCQITNNKFVGKGNSALVEVRDQPLVENVNLRFERVFFNHNYCNHLGAGSGFETASTVMLEGRAGVVMGNQVKGGVGGMGSIDMGNMAGTMVGNITARGFRADPDFPTPEANFNRQI